MPGKPAKGLKSGSWRNIENNRGRNKKRGVHFPRFLSFTNYFFRFPYSELQSSTPVNWRSGVRIA